MARKPGITFERHQQLGAELAQLNEKLKELSVELSIAYPFSGDLSRPYKNIKRAATEISDARAHLDHNYFGEHGEKAIAQTYYPGLDPEHMREKVGE